MKTGMEGRWGEVVTWAYPTRRAGEGTIELLSLAVQLILVRVVLGAFVVRLIEGMVPTVPTACVFPLGGGGNITAANNNIIIILYDDDRHQPPHNS